MPTLTFLGENVSAQGDEQARLIDICSSVDTSLMFGCQDGACGTCLVVVVENAQNLSPMEDAEREYLEATGAAPDERLACQCRLLGDVSVRVV